MTWLQGRSDVSYRSKKPLRLQGNVTMASGRVAIESMKAEIDGGGVEGRVALASRQAGGSRFDAELKGERLDFDAVAAFARSLAGPQTEWPDEAFVSLDIDRATSAGQELQPFVAKLGYGPNTISIDQFRIGIAGGAMLEGWAKRRLSTSNHRAGSAVCAGAGLAAGWDWDKSRSRAP